MKSKTLFFSTVFLLLLSSCRQHVPTLPGSGGKTCEIIVIMPKDQWRSAIGDSIRFCFAGIQPGLNQPEPYFDLVNIEPKNFNESEMFRHHRNILIVETESGSEPKFELFQDAWAFPQIVMKFRISDTQDFNRLYTPRKAGLMQAVYAKEYQRIQKVFKAGEATEVTDRLRQQYGFQLIFPDGFDFSAAQADFGWIRKESKDYGQGVLFSIYPYQGLENFQLTDILEHRNRMCRRVPGPADNSYMTTETSIAGFEPFSRPINLNGLYAVETRGLWKLEGDFMGGPFVNYVIADTAKQRIIMLDAYLYSPRKPKRDLLLQIEGIARSFQLTPPQTSAVENKQ